jgi:hypothetical protein
MIFNDVCSIDITVVLILKNLNQNSFCANSFRGMGTRAKRGLKTRGGGGRGGENEKDLTSDDNEPVSPKQQKGKSRERETDAARVAAEEVAALEADEVATHAKKPKSDKPSEKDAPTNNKSERQRVVELNRLEAEAAQKRADAEKESLRLAEENKKLRLMLQKKKDPTPSTPSSSKSKPPRSNLARREKKVLSRYFAMFIFG